MSTKDFAETRPKRKFWNDQYPEYAHFSKFIRRRIYHMRSEARTAGKFVPTVAAICALTNRENKCPDCGRTMTWSGKESRALVASLQHYRDGTLAIVCQSCNSRHNAMPGDTYRDMPKDHKLCPVCKEIKPLTEYSRSNYRGGDLRRHHQCKACVEIKKRQWRLLNREKHNENQRNQYARRKAREVKA